MRVGPVGFAFDTLDEVLDEAKKCAEVTHNHPEGIKGAQAVAAVIFLARQGENKDVIKKYRPYYDFDVTCQGSVPEAIIAFLESGDYEDAVRKAISIGGDSDTIACITPEVSRRLFIKRYRTVS
jgi:ADP-ribosylglycohydrolase